MGPRVAVSLVVAAGVTLALGLYWEQGVLAVAAMLVLALVIVGSIAAAGSQEPRPVVGPSRSMGTVVLPLALVGTMAVTGLVVALGLYWGQGVLAVVAMLLLATVIVGSLVLSGKGSLHLPSLSLAGAGSPLVLVGAMAAAGLVVAAGLYWEQGVLAVAGMLLLAVTTVGGIARAGARPDMT